MMQQSYHGTSTYPATVLIIIFCLRIAVHFVIMIIIYIFKIFFSVKIIANEISESESSNLRKTSLFGIDTLCTGIFCIIQKHMVFSRSRRKSTRLDHVSLSWKKAISLPRARSYIEQNEIKLHYVGKLEAPYGMSSSSISISSSNSTGLAIHFARHIERCTGTEAKKMSTRSCNCSRERERRREHHVVRYVHGLRLRINTKNDNVIESNLLQDVIMIDTK
ncbi:unnamed protein product [Trichogramma brassicae]|uniref:Uncharacterized protein n=1 Tax=Trichogramma brassicae TaxID=86971 RepID=A0A6H5I8J5_9HYME|nr:unnamed protein product [Trichogramma brassicae]